jgi:hypothetical protein
MGFNYSLGDFKDAKTFAKAQVENQGGRTPLKTTQSQSSEPILAMTTYSISDALQGVALYKPTGATYDAFNQELSKELGAMGQETLFTRRDDKLNPYDVVYADPDPSKAGNIASTAYTSASSTQPTGTYVGGTGKFVSGKVQDLAQKIITHPNITFDPGNPRGQFETLANGGSVPLSMGKTEVDVRLLGLVVGAADQFPIQISSFIRPESPTSHGAGFCIDIDYIDHKQTNGSDELANKLVSAVIDMMDTSWSIGFGRGTRSTPLPPANGKNVYDFPDNPNHVHIQIK